MTHRLTIVAAAALAAASAFAQEGTWTVKPGSGLKYDGGDAFSFAMINQVQTLFTNTGAENAVDTSSFKVLRARTTLSGHAFKKCIEYFVQTEAMDTGTNSIVKEARATWNFASDEDGTVGLRIGQGKSLFGLEAMSSIQGLGFVLRSSAAREFSDKYSRGAWLIGKHNNSKLRWAFGTMNGPTTGEENVNNDDETGYVANIQFDPLGDFFGGKMTAEPWRHGDLRDGDRNLLGTIGAAYASDSVDNNVTETETDALTLNTVWSLQGFQVLAEFFDRTVSETGQNDIETDGYAVAATYTMPKNGDSDMRWGFGARYSTVDLVDTGEDGNELSVVMNAFYHGHACKTQIELTRKEDENSTDDDYVFSLAFQLLF